MAQNIPGGYSNYRAIEKEEMEIFEKVMQGWTGVSYTPLLVSAQVVKGMNYSFLCETLPAVFLPKAGLALVTIYSFQGEAELIDIQRLVN